MDTAGDAAATNTAEDDAPILERSASSPVGDPAVLTRTLYILSFLYFLNGISSSTFGRFAAVYYLSKGLNPFQIGILEGTMPTVRAITGPLWGVLSDVLASKKKVSQWNRLFSTLCLMLFAFPSLSDSFFKILMISTGTAIFSGAGSILDAYALEVCEKLSRQLYGRVRLWMAVSWGVGSLIMGAVSTYDDDDWTWNFILFGAFGLAAIVFTFVFVPDQTPVEKNKNTKRDWAELRAVISSGPFLFLLWEAIIFGGALGVIERLMFVFLQGTLGGSSLLCGVSVFVTVICEIPIFYYSEWVQNRLGHKVMITMALLAYVLRVFGYTYLTPATRWYILGLEVLHGFTFALMWLYMVDRANTFTPHGWMGTTQSIIGMTYQCLGAGGGSVAGGWVMDTYGPLTMFRGAGFIVMAALGVHWIVWFVAWSRHK